MAFDKAVYNKALAEIEERRRNAEDDRIKRHDVCVARFPRIAQCEKEMRDTALETVKVIGMGQNAEQFVKNLSEKNLKAQAEIADILKGADLPDDYLKIKYTCPECNDTGFVEGRMCSCLRKLIRTVSFKNLCGKFPLEKSTFDNFNLSFYPDCTDEKGVNIRKKMTQIYNFCKAYADDFGTGSGNILMMGETGLGKTHLSLAIAGTAIKKGYGVIYGSAQNLLNTLEDEKFGRIENTGAEKSLLECDLLIIDDLGAEFSTPYTVSAVYNIINTRMMSNKPVIISTNLSVQDIEDRYMRRVTSRILGEYKVLVFRGRDIRSAGEI